MFDLPSKLNDFVEKENSYSKAVMYYCKARKTLEYYKQMPTFKSIEDDCLTIIDKLKEKLYEQIDSSESSTEKILESVNLLNELGDPMENLCSKYLNRIEKSLQSDLAILVLDIDLLSIVDEEQLRVNSQTAMDILEFVDHGCNNFLANLSSMIQSFNLMFNTNKKGYLARYILYSRKNLIVLG